MAFPVGWPPRPASATRSIRFYASAAATANFSDRAYLFSTGAGVNTITPLPYVRPGSTAPVSVGDTLSGGSPMGTGQAIQDVAPRTHENPPATQEAVVTPMVWSSSIRIVNDGAGDLEVSFDGTNVHSYIPAGREVLFLNRHEAGVAVRGVAAATPTFHIEAW